MTSRSATPNGPAAGSDSPLTASATWPASACPSARTVWTSSPTISRASDAAVSACGSTFATTFARRRMVASWQSRCTSSSRCEMYSTAHPSPARRRSVRKSWSASCGVSTEVGSSMIRRRGSCRRQRTISMRCRSPTERSATSAPGSSGSPYSADTAVTRLASAPGSNRPGSASAMFSTTVSASNREKCWKTMAIPRRRAAAGLAMTTGRPRQRSAPAVGCSAPYMILTRVDLPAPFSPSRAWIWPGRSFRVTRSFAVKSP